MEESQEILLNSLQSSGVSIPPNVSSIRDLKPAALVSICAQCLNLIDHTASFSTSPPNDSSSSMALQFKICTDIASGIKNLGYIGDMSFHKFLYPSEEDLYKLIRFLVERLSELSEDGRTADVNNVNGRRKLKEDYLKSSSEDWTEKADNERLDLSYQKLGAKLEDLRLKTEVPELLSAKAEDASVSWFHNSLADELTNVLSGENSTEELMGAGRDTSVNKETAAWRDDEHVPVFEQKVTSTEQSSKIRYETENFLNKEKLRVEEVTAKSSGLQHLEEELELLRAAAEMAFDDKHPIDSYLERLNKQVDAKKHNLVELESEWETVRRSLEEKKRSLEESLYANNPDAQEKLQKLREVELEKQSVLSQIRKREEEHSKLSADLEKQPKLASRRSYIERIKDLTKNSRKQDADIERILKETRELQLESNSIQERLHRTYAVVDEMVFREAKKDHGGRQAYRLLTSIHESFEQISEKILATDRVRREVTEHEKKLAAMASRSLNVDKLQADLDAITKENEYLEQRLQDK